MGGVVLRYLSEQTSVLSELVIFSYIGLAK